jgi:hypothetical protein
MRARFALELLAKATNKGVVQMKVNTGYTTGYAAPAAFQGILGEVVGVFQQYKWEYIGGQSNYADFQAYQQSTLGLFIGFAAAFFFNLIGAAIGAGIYWYMASEVRARLTLMEDGNVWVESDLGSFAVGHAQEAMGFLINNPVDNSGRRNAYLGGIVALGVVMTCCSCSIFFS